MAQKLPKIFQGQVRVELSATVKRLFEKFEAEYAAATHVSARGRRVALKVCKCVFFRTICLLLSF